MTYQQVKYFFAITVLALFMQSCANDENDTFETEEFAQIISDAGEAAPATLRGNRPQGGNGPQGGNNLGNANLVRDWVDLFLELERYALGMRPNASARAIAYINLAAYETVVPGMNGFVSNDNFIPGLNIQRDGDGGGQGGPGGASNIDYEIALNACYADVLQHFLLNVPANAAEEIADLEEEKEDRLSREISQQLVNDSKAWGASVAAQIIAFSQTDTKAEAQIRDPQPTSYVPPAGLGYWTFSAEPERALFPYWGSTRTFVIGTDETSTVAPPMQYSTAQGSPYFQEMEDVYRANNEAREEQDEQLWIAEFWSDDVETVMFSPPARQLSISNQLIRQYRLNLEEALYMNLKLGFALNDAAVSTWADKYEYMVMRPSVYIHEHIDADFQTNLYRLIPWPNPSFPGYPSGHSSFASAAGGVFIDFFGNNTDFTDRSHQGRNEFLGEPRNFNSFEDMAEENAYSRVPLGVHLRMDCTEGLRLGYEISDAINDYDLRLSL